MITVEIAYAKPEQQYLLSLELPGGITAKEAIEQSGILELCPEIDLNSADIGIFSNMVTSAHKLTTGDRVEIYRPLCQDPKAARLKRLGK